MADILIVAATYNEVGFLSGGLKKSKPGTITSISKGSNHNFDVLITGPGMVATTYRLAKALKEKQYKLSVNIGICGSLSPELKPVRVVNVVTDQFGDFGAEDGNNFIDAFDLGFDKPDSFPFKNKQLKNSFSKSLKSLKAIPSVTGITVQKSTGSLKSKKLLEAKFGEVIESMEGAAFFYVCNSEKVACIQLRAISNMVEKRNRNNWKIKEAIDALEGVTGLLLMEIDTIQV